MNQICCLNPECDNPQVPENTKFCPSCGVPLITLRNRYRPIKSLGGGGFAKTYLASDIDKLNEKCVIKQFAPQTQGTAGLQKATELFLQEAQQLQQLGEHPQIPALLAYFNENNRLYLVQQFIDGENLLKELEQQGIFPELKIRALLQDLLSVLKVVHSQNIIHRDIKPENIMRRRNDRKLILIDFGASKQLQGTVKTGTTIGTFGYSPLEQMQDAKVYPASDLYSIGATCFHLLTKVHPWQLWQEDGYGWVKEWRNHLQQPISPELGQILDKLLQKDAQQRYQSAEEVLTDLNPLKISPTVHYRPPLKSQTAVKPQFSRPGFMKLAGLVVGGFVLAVVGQSIFSPTLRPEATAKPEPTPISEATTKPEPRPIEDGGLISSVGMDYTKLRDLLTEGRWKQANDETVRVMLVVAKQEKEGLLFMTSVENFPCKDLQTIDKLWVKHSNSRFGFSVQKPIYQSLGGTREFNRNIAEAFGEKIGWRKERKWKSYSELTFDKIAPPGHLPSDRSAGGFRWGLTRGILFSRMDTCKL
ncbi:serine/threonine-protein kinase [Nodularia spumigena CS-584]|uniref:serine/threonine-protein kinase n=1 Tax=Nodularia spumigena TaxID=70799 RepID=UPI000B000954|nr:serine/threonine-protein kinase [Nodularia spumigena]MDB9381336.1 serine/threonine-protein kinase [Nodularia spumigena CS-584]